MRHGHVRCGLQARIHRWGHEVGILLLLLLSVRLVVVPPACILRIGHLCAVRLRWMRRGLLRLPSMLVLRHVVSVLLRLLLHPILEPTLLPLLIHLACVMPARSSLRLRLRPLRIGAGRKCRGCRRLTRGLMSGSRRGCLRMLLRGLLGCRC